MKTFKTLSIAALLIAALQFPACKGENKADDSKDTTTVATQTTEPVNVADDDQLTTKTKDATKDFPGVTATVGNGEITLSGNIDRDKLPNLMKSLNALNAKKINNNLTIND